jgi:uncharacterized damage-inducible protein DinB
MKQLLQAQYEGVKGARQALFSYLKTIDEAHLRQPVPTFNNSSILSLLTHVANTYVSWLKFFDLQAPGEFFKDEDVNTLADVERIFEEANILVTEFLPRHEADYETVFTKKHRRTGIMVTTTPLMLFTHVITHEFHHKGQILTMSRLLGYIPADTDVIRF